MAFGNTPYFVRLFVALHLLVFVAWNFAPDLRPYLVTHFLVSGLHLAAGYYWTLLTSVFSHKDLFHLILNTMVLLSFGPGMEQVMGHLRFLIFYLLAGITASLAHVFLSSYFLGLERMPALGASGALAGLILVFSLLFPRNKILLFGIIPMPAIVGALAFVFIDIWGLMAQRGGGGLPIGHGAHLGGAAFGALYYFLWGRKLRRRIYY